MKEIDRRGRISLRLMIVGFLVTFDLMFLLTILLNDSMTNPADRYFVIAAMVLCNIGFLCALFFACRSTPRVYFSDEGVYIQPFFRKKLYPWSDIRQATILGHLLRSKHIIQSKYARTPMYEYRFYLLTKEGSVWKRGDTATTYRLRNRKHLLWIPLTEESKEYVKRYHGRLAFDESHGKKILRRLTK